MELTVVGEKVRNDLRQAKTILIVANCSIEYWGRSRSVIDDGDRLILIKPDTTLLIHSTGGFKPVNWMASPNDMSVEAGEDLTIFCQRTKEPFEEMKILVHHVLDYKSYDSLRDTKQLTLTHTEKDMQRFIADNPGEVDPGFRLKSTEFRCPLGFLDLYGKIGETYTIVELKADKAGLPAVLQLKRYRDWATEHLKQDVRGILMAPSITPNALKLIHKEKLEFKKFSKRKIKRQKIHPNTLEKWISQE